MGAVSYSMEATGVFSARLWDRARCAAMLKRLEGQAAWEQAPVLIGSGGGGAQMQVTTAPETRLAYTIAPTYAPEIYQEFEEKLETALQPLIREVWEVELPGCVGTQLVRYPAGGHFSLHNDTADSDPVMRYFTVLCYLNDNFEGGRTGFPHLRFFATPAAGKVLVFPAQYFHCAEPVTRGEKYVLVTWVCGPLPVRWI